MKILSWNCRGLQQAAAVRALLDVQTSRSPDIIFLLETHLDEWPAECLRRRLKMDHKEVVRSDGKSGGLLLYWKKEALVSLKYKSENFIDVYVGNDPDKMWRFTGMYGEPCWENKYLTWQRMRNLAVTSNLPWLMMGDLNDIAYSFEKEGRRARPDWYMKAFQEAIDDCNLVDCGYIGDKFTWHRGMIRERLDRALAMESWQDMFLDATVHH